MQYQFYYTNLDVQIYLQVSSSSYINMYKGNGDLHHDLKLVSKQIIIVTLVIMLKLFK